MGLYQDSNQMGRPPLDAADAAVASNPPPRPGADYRERVN